MKIGDDVVLPPHKRLLLQYPQDGDVVLPPHKRLLLQYPQDGDVDGDFGFTAGMEAAAVKRKSLKLDQHNHADGGQSHDPTPGRPHSWTTPLLPGRPH